MFHYFYQLNSAHYHELCQFLLHIHLHQRQYLCQRFSSSFLPFSNFSTKPPVPKAIAYFPSLLVDAVAITIELYEKLLYNNQLKHLSFFN